MSPARYQAMPLGGAGMLETAVSYALGVAGSVTQSLLPRPTPCRDWDLRQLLLHAGESLSALLEGFEEGRVGIHPPAAWTDGAANPALAFQESARSLVTSCRNSDDRRPVTIGGCPMAASVLALAGALEIAVHGWDISQACGRCLPIPPGLASELLDVAPLLVTAERHPLFAEPVSVPAAAGPSDRLTAFLGRAPSGIHGR